MDIPGSRAYHVNDTIEATCSAAGYPLPTIIWTKDGLALPLNRYIVRNVTTLTVSTSTLTVYRAIFSDTGVYYCSLMNRVGNINSTMLNVAVFGKTFQRL